MAHPVSVTDQQVFDILDRLDSAGGKITPNRVRTEAGGGNPARYRLLIARWKVARALEASAAKDPGAARTALFDDIVRTLEVELFKSAAFLDGGFRSRLARGLAAQLGSTLIRRGFVSEDALGAALPDPFLTFLAADAQAPAAAR